MNVAPNDFSRSRRLLTFSAILALLFYCLAKDCHAAGAVIAWGNNNDHQSDVPPGLVNVTKVAAGALHSVALKSDKKVICWGSNSFGQTNVPPNLSNVVAVAGGATYSLALKDDGSLVQWGSLP